MPNDALGNDHPEGAIYYECVVRLLADLAMCDVLASPTETR